MIAIELNRDASQPLYIQIRDALREAVRDGRLKIGDRLPTVAAFAETLGVTPSTVRRALKDLTRSGHIASHVGRGTFVTDSSAPAAAHTRPTEGEAPPPMGARQDSEAARVARRLRRGIADSLESLLPLSRRSGLIQLTDGLPAQELISDSLFETLNREALQTGAAAYMGYSHPLGLPALRECLAARFRRRGLSVSADQILITCGSQQALALIAMQALQSTHRIIFETPCYTAIPKFFGSLGHWVETVMRDAEGPLPTGLTRFNQGPPPLIYTCPQLHNPMGTNMTPARQRHLLDWVAGRDGLVIADEVFADLQEDDLAGGPLYARGLRNLVIAGSLSKSFTGGLRIGWLVAQQERIDALAALKRTMDLGGPPLMEGMALALLESDRYDKHLPAARAHYARRRDAALEALACCMPANVRWTQPDGGFNLWIELPEGYSSIALYLSSIERGVAFVPGPFADVDHRFVNALRIGYSGLPPAQVTEGIERLADATRNLLRHPPDGGGLSSLGEFI
jgi:DNA-binding transcriptional MocR family regulator